MAWTFSDGEATGGSLALVVVPPLLGLAWWMKHNHPWVLGGLILAVIAVFVWGAWGYDERQAARKTVTPAKPTPRPTPRPTVPKPMRHEHETKVQTLKTGALARRQYRDRVEPK